MKKCAHCEIEKPIDDFPRIKKTWGDKVGYRPYYICKPCKGLYEKARYEARPERREKVRRSVAFSHMKRTYGLSEDDYEKIVARQNSCCGICDKKLNTEINGKNKREAFVDHDHSTGVVRGLLCHNCNVAIGHLNDDIHLLERAIQWISTVKSATKE
jgi:hypothetical protein